MVVIKEILSLVSKESGLNKAMFWGLELRPVNKSNIIQRNSRMTELEIEELESNLSKMTVTRKNNEVLIIQVVTYKKKRREIS